VGLFTFRKVITCSRKQLNHGDRWYQYRWSDAPPIDPAIIVRTSANTHLVPADDNIKARLLKVRRGEIVNLKGYLINVKNPDTGACELMWVAEVAVE
jgi:hypothetical protein